MKIKSKKIPLKEVATFLNGYAFKPSDWSKEGLPIIRIQNLTGTNKEFNYYNGDYNEKYIIEDGDILISWSASLGIFLWKNMRGILNQHIFKVIFDKNIEIDKTYFLHCMKYLIKKIEKNIHGSTMKHITRPEFEKINFPIYEIDIQRKFSKNLIFITKIIENNKKLLDELVELCKSLFTKFNKNGVEKQLNDVADIIMGQSPLSQSYNKDKKGLPFYQGKTEFSDIYIKEPTVYCNSPIKVVEENDILMSVRAPVGDVNIATQKSCIGRGLASIKSKKIDYLYLFYLLKEQKSKIEKIGVGSTFKAINKNNISTLKISIVEKDKQDKIRNYLSSIEKLKFTIMTIILITYENMKKKGVEKD